MQHAVQTIVILLVVGVLYDLIVGLPWIGRVTRVVDGDSVETITRRKMRRIRLAGIDAPEYRQDHGKAARTALASLVEGRLVLFVPFGRDTYARFPCVMITSTGIVSWRMALSGDAWPDSIVTRILHVPARLSKRGLWAGNAQLPKTWRRMNPRV